MTRLAQSAATILTAMLLLLTPIAWSPIAWAQDAVAPDVGPEKLSDPKLEARAVALQRNFRCLVCQGESLDESNAKLADDLRRLIRARIEAGQSDQQITAFLVSRYGNVILMKPPLEPGTYVLWFGPLVVLVLGGGATALVVLRARARARSA